MRAFWKNCFVVILVVAAIIDCVQPEVVFANERSNKKNQKWELENLRSARIKRETPPADAEPDIFDIDEKVDPFHENLKWIRFVHSVNQIATSALELMNHYTSTLKTTWTEKISATPEDKKKYFQDFSSNFSVDFTPILSHFKLVTARLEHSGAHTKINPLIGLTTIPACIELAKKNTGTLRDQTRLKWIEINAMATTIHHVFDHLLDVFKSDGLLGLEDAIQIHYPSWVTNTSIKEDSDTFESMDVESIVHHIDTEMTALGEKHHLIRGMEKILRKTKVGWDPRETDQNMFCYGNNEFGIIMDEFDLLTDAALFLSVSDIKFALIQMMREISLEMKIWREPKIDPEVEKKGPGFEEKFKEFEKTMHERIEKKIKLGELKADDGEIVPGPLLFKCDRPPPSNDTKDDHPILSAPNCPPGVYVQNNQVFQNGTEIKFHDGDTKVTHDGQDINCIKLETVATDPNGTVLLHKVKDGKCVDTNGTEIPDCHVKTVPVLVDDSGSPIVRDNLVEYPKPPSEWGKVSPPEGLSPRADHQHPPLDPQGGPPTANDSNPGYIDTRTPLFDPTTTAQFAGAFGGYLESELVLNPFGKCLGTCMDYHGNTPTCTNKTTHCDLYRQSHCEPGKNCMKMSNCPTKARRCVRAAPKVSICEGKPDSGRLYEWLNLNGKEVGSGSACGAKGNATTEPEAIDPTKSHCEGEVLVAKERWEMEENVILNTPQYCELCLCVCNDPLTKEGQHYFDLAESLADVDKGYIVTGVKFEQTGQTMRLIVEQGFLTDPWEGSVDDAKLVWKSHPDKEVPKGAIPLGSTGFRKMNLDIVQGHLGEVVSGVRFRLEEDRLELDVQFVKIDKHGVTNPPITEWRSPKHPTPVVPRKKVDLSEACSPLRQNGPSQPFNVPTNSEFIEFDATSLEKDAGQSVVPFIDIQSVQHIDRNRRRPLVAVGILYKSKRNSGGLVSPTVTVWEKSYLEGI